MLGSVTEPIMKMKTLRKTLTVVLGLAALSGLQAADKKQARAEVTFTEPEKFTDAANGPRGSDYGREGVLADLERYIIDRASMLLPEGQKLSVTITDIDLAGEIEPWRTGSAHDVRIVKDIYSPRIELSYTLTDASGAVLKEETRKLSDTSFNMKLHANRSDPRIHEKGLIDDWMRRDFPKAKN